MNLMHTIYDRNGERFDFCEDEENQFHVEYEKNSDTLSIRQWTPEIEKSGGMWPVCQVFYSPRRYVKDMTL